MSTFPQLSNGALSQYPVTFKRAIRTATNALEDGSTIRMADLVHKIRWELKYSGLSRLEYSALLAFFISVQGQLQTFVFVDPTANLLAWSEDLTQVVWEKDPLIQIISGINDPLHGTAATRLTNTAQAAQGVSQAIAGPGSYRYCFCVYLRCDQACAVTLRFVVGNVEVAEPHLVGSEWVRCTLRVAPASSTNGVTFGLLLPAGVAVDVFGMQVEAQPAPGIYKRTTGAGGVYLKSRLAQDQLEVTVDAPGRYSTQVSIVTSVVAN
jgi:hypothetical protein